MTWIAVGLSAVLVLVLLGLYLSMTAGRLDRLHTRIDSSYLTLTSHLLRRSSVALELSTSGLLDPVSSVVIADAAHLARTAQDDGSVSWARAESDLTAALDAAFEDSDDVEYLMSNSVGAELLGELAATMVRIALSRRFLNDAVRACRQLRAQRLVRWFHLAGHTDLPHTFEMDDAIPRGLATRGEGGLASDALR